MACKPGKVYNGELVHKRGHSERLRQFKPDDRFLDLPGGGSQQYIARFSQPDFYLGPIREELVNNIIELIHSVPVPNTEWIALKLGKRKWYIICLYHTVYFKSHVQERNKPLIEWCKKDILESAQRAVKEVDVRGLHKQAARRD